MNPLWYVVIVLGIAVAILYRRVYVLEQLHDRESYLTTELIAVTAKLLLNCPGYNHDEPSRAKLLATHAKLRDQAQRQEKRISENPL